MTKLSVVLTTIQLPTPSMRRLAEVLAATRSPLLVIGDQAGPPSYPLPGAELISLADQFRLPLELARGLPTRHYARKNLGYLIAINRGTESIYETDDDNAPNEFWAPRSETVTAQAIEAGPWFNGYRAFTDEFIWPRGFPLARLRDPAAHGSSGDRCERPVRAPVQQGLADLSPDVDAIWRLVLDRPVFFQRRPSVWLPAGTWCPFNSQSTWWWPVAYPLLYLPSFCSFRMTDIWRSFVAQRCLWELGLGLVFHASEVVQQRNAHDLIRDFHHEVPGYEQNERFTRRLEAVRLESGPAAVGANLIRCYEELVRAGFFPADELRLVHSWLDALEPARAGIRLAA